MVALLCAARVGLLLCLFILYYDSVCCELVRWTWLFSLFNVAADCFADLICSVVYALLCCYEWCLFGLGCLVDMWFYGFDEFCGALFILPRGGCIASVLVICLINVC